MTSNANLISFTLISLINAQPGCLALRAHRRPDVHTTELTSFRRQIYAVTYGDPPDPPAVAAGLAALTGRDEAGGDQRAG